MTLLESLKSLPKEKIRSDTEILKVFIYLQEVIQEQPKTPGTKKPGQGGLR
jgi:hypothetical protein